MAKLCKDCQWCDEEYVKVHGSSFAKCNAPENMCGGHFDYFSGEVIDVVRRAAYCDKQRSIKWPLTVLLTRCGPDGKWYKPKLEGNTMPNTTEYLDAITSKDQ